MWWVIGFFLLLVLFPISLKLINKNNILLNSDSLHLQYLFQLSVLLPLVSSVYFMVWLGSEYPFRLDSTGFNSFLNIQKFPLGILALSPILGAFVVYIHRSIQTTKQIEVTEKKNKVDIYLSQRKFVIEKLKNIKIAHYGKISNASDIYDRFIGFDNYNNELMKNSFEMINSKIKCVYNYYIDIERHAYSNTEKSLSLDLRLKLTQLESTIKFIVKYCGIKNDKFKISEEINNFLDKYNLSNGNYNYRNDIISLVEEITLEILALYDFLWRLFKIILLNSNVFMFLPNLEKISPADFP
ncbi:TPA: hypothetical protein ACWMJN_002138 [Morganella morganii]